uniref:Uncharacterized protein n=1 Tax=Arion vulgaris TaxID=1028688 RepID=A0A0B6Z6K5_9EUPU
MYKSLLITLYKTSKKRQDFDVEETSVMSKTIARMCLTLSLPPIFQPNLPHYFWS